VQGLRFRVDFTALFPKTWEPSIITENTENKPASVTDMFIDCYLPPINVHHAEI